MLSFARTMLEDSFSPWEGGTVCASAFCQLPETQIRLADVLSMHQGRSLKKHWVVLGPEHFKLSTHILRKLWQFQHSSWLFVHKRIMAFTSSRTAAQISTRYACGNCQEESPAKWVMLHSTWDLGDVKVQRGGKIRIWIHLSCALSRWSSAERSKR